MAKGIVSGGLNGGGGSNIKSIQRGTTTIASGVSSSPVVGIASVDLTKSIVRIENSGSNSVTNRPDNDMAEIHFLNNTQIQASRIGIDGILTIEWEVIEFNNVKSLQSGNASYLAKTTLDITVSSIVTSKSLLFYSAKYANFNATDSRFKLSGKVKTSTAINFSTNSSDGTYTMTIYWQVIEFN